MVARIDKTGQASRKRGVKIQTGQLTGRDEMRI
jgi:hypothetical protein